MSNNSNQDKLSRLKNAINKNENSSLKQNFQANSNLILGNVVTGKIYHVIKSYALSSKHHLPDGTEIRFIGGKALFDLDDSYQHTIYDYFIDEIYNKKNPYWYVDANETTYDSDSMLPIEQVKKNLESKYIQEIRARIAASIDPNNDVGTSLITLYDRIVGMTTTRDVESTSAGSASINSSEV